MTPHAAVPLIALCGCKCRQTLMFGMVCHEACARPEGHRGECLCRWCLTMRLAQRRFAEQAEARRHQQAVEQMVFARQGQIRERGTSHVPRRPAGAR